MGRRDRWLQRFYPKNIKKESRWKNGNSANAKTSIFGQTSRSIVK